MRVNNNSRVNKAYKVVREFNPEEMNELIKLLKEDIGCSQRHSYHSCRGHHREPRPQERVDKQQGRE